MNHARKLAWRSLRKQRLYAAVIILSLSLGLSVSNILTAFIVRELSTDAFHGRKDRIFRLLSDDPFEAGGRIIFIPENAGQHLADRYPELEAVCRIFDLSRSGVDIEAGPEVFPEMMVLGVDSTFFDLFDFPFYQGALKGVLRPGEVVLTKRTAGRLFGDRHVAGETVTISADTTALRVSVAAVIDDPPQNSHLQFDGLLPFDAFPAPWGGATHYVLLRAGADPEALAAKVSDDADMPSLIGPGEGVYSFQPLPQVYFDESQQRPYYRTRSRLLIGASWVVAFLILFTASFNFLNLIVIAHLKRRRELGIQKTFGASREDLRRQAVMEVVSIVALSFGISLLFTALLLPWFNRAFQTDLPMRYFAEVKVMGGFAVMVTALCITFTLYLTNHLVRLDPVDLLTGRSGLKASFNKWLFTAQFIIAVGMIFCTAVLVRQMQYIRKKPLGFNRSLLELQAPDERHAGKMAVLRERLKADPGLQRLAMASGNPISGNQIVRYELENAEIFAPYFFSGDPAMPEVLGLELIAGRSLSANRPGGVLVNEQLVRRFGWEEPVGNIIPGDPSGREVIGVVRDFNIVSLKEHIPPVVIGYSSDAPRILLDYSGQPVASLLPEIERAWQAVFPEAQFKYKLAEDELLHRHKEDILFFRVVAAFALASVLITCFGLFALAWATTKSRSREIGIRKVLGASPRRIMGMLLLDYSRWVLLAVVIAIPPSFYVMHRWLEHFAFHSTIDGWVFVAAALLVVLVTFLSVGFQTLRSALSNPAAELKYE